LAHSCKRYKNTIYSRVVGVRICRGRESCGAFKPLSDVSLPAFSLFPAVTLQKINASLPVFVGTSTRFIYQRLLSFILSFFLQLLVTSSSRVTFPERQGLHFAVSPSTTFVMVYFITVDFFFFVLSPNDDDDKTETEEKQQVCY